MKPTEYEKERNLELEHASQAIRWLFKKGEIITPMYEKHIKLKGRKYKVWRLQWEITKEFLKAITGIGMGCKPQRMDIGKRIYTLDITKTGTIDYITDKEEKC